MEGREKKGREEEEKGGNGREERIYMNAVFKCYEEPPSLRVP